MQGTFQLWKQFVENIRIR